MKMTTQHERLTACHASLCGSAAGAASACERPCAVHGTTPSPPCAGCTYLKRLLAETACGPSALQAAQPAHVCCNSKPSERSQAVRGVACTLQVTQHRAPAGLTCPTCLLPSGAANRKSRSPGRRRGWGQRPTPRRLRRQTSAACASAPRCTSTGRGSRGWKRAVRSGGCPPPRLSGRGG